MFPRVFLLLLFAVPSISQSTLGTLVGTVTDPSTAVLPNVSVSIRNTQTAQERNTLTESDGAFHFPNVEAGTYEITVNQPGFASNKQVVQLLARQVLRANVRLDVAGVSETVQVSEVQPVIETDSSVLDSSQSGEDINRLALNFRATNSTSPIVVATLSQGVQQDRTGSISVAGLLPFMTSYSIDGISTQRTRGGGASRELFPSVESISEFKVSSASSNAEFMQATDITTTSKSGSNTFHGTAFWFFQDGSLNSVDRFAPKDSSGKPIKPDIRSNSFGGSAGGPIVRNRTFFFGTYEGVRRPNESTLSQILPPDAFRTGDLSSISRQLTNPFTNQPFPNNQIPVNPASAIILNELFEKPNQSTGTAINRPNYIVNFPGDFKVNGLDIRGDHRFSTAQQIFSRFTHKTVDTTGSGGSSWNTKQGQRSNRTEVRQLAGALNSVLKTTLLNELRWGYSNTVEIEDYPLAARGTELMKQLGFTGLPPAPASGGLPSIEFLDGSFISTGGTKPRNILSRTYQLSDNLTWVKNNHSVTAGIAWPQVEYKDQVTFFAGEDFGRYAFDGGYTGNAFADFLLGLPVTTGYAQNAPDGNPYSNHWAFFVQDSWRVSPKITLDYGLRYDLR